MDLTAQEQAQIQAALLLWNITVKHSRTHIAFHPTIRHCFDAEAPMMAEDIEVLALRFGAIGPSLPDICSVKDMCKSFGWTPDWVYRRLRKYKIRPVARGRYNRRDLRSLYRDAHINPPGPIVRNTP